MIHVNLFVAQITRAEGPTMVAVASGVAVDDGKVERKPLMTPTSILMMNMGFFGIQFSFGLTQTAINPLFTFDRRQTRTHSRSSTWRARSLVC